VELWGAGFKLGDLQLERPSWSRRAVKASGGTFKLRDRALHVYGEAARVPQFRDACNSGGGAEGSEGDKLQRLGALLDASHASCRCAEFNLFQTDCNRRRGFRGPQTAATGHAGGQPRQLQASFDMGVLSTRVYVH